MKTVYIRSLFQFCSVVLLCAMLAACGGNSNDETRFLMRITNVSNPSTLPTTGGESVAIPLSPGVVVIHTAPQPLFANNQPDRGEGLEAIAEDGDPSALAAVLEQRVGSELEAVHVFNTPVGADSPAPIFPGESYEIEFDAQPGDQLSFATMFVQSNDLFFAPGGMGINLFDADGNPVSGDVTSQAPIWDAGTEADTQLGVGPNQAPRQSGPNVGDPDPNNTVRFISAEGPFEFLPADADVIQVTITPMN